MDANWRFALVLVPTDFATPLSIGIYKYIFSLSLSSSIVINQESSSTLPQGIAGQREVFMISLQLGRKKILL